MSGYAEDAMEMMNEYQAAKGREPIQFYRKKRSAVQKINARQEAKGREPIKFYRKRKKSERA